MIKLDAVINDKKLLASIQKGVDVFNRSTAGKSKLNLKINEKGFRQPLGRITGDLDKFESALAASNARVIAFGASTAVIGGVTRAFKELAATTVNVQKQFADINRILNVSNKEFDTFSNSLFNIGKKTATTFDDAAKAALEFARQGLGMNETLKRTSDALTLVRLTGVNADKAVSALTATVNAFQQSSLTTTQALNKFVAVETKFAVSAKDLMEGLGRVGSAAVDAKVDFDELNAMIAAVQQQTGRGGAVIGNALKTIFTRLQRRDTLTALEQFNVEVQDMQGNILPAMTILQNFSKAYKTLTDANKAYLREQVAGVFQANILSAIVKDINSDFQVYNRALTTSTEATNEAANANARLNQTISALLSQTGTDLIRLQENIGKITFEPIARAILGPFRDIVANINSLLDGEGMGSDFANGLLKGIRNIIAGPGLVAAIAVIGKIFITTAGYITKAIPTLVGITTEKQKQANLQATIDALLRSDENLSKLIAQHEGNAAKQAGILAGHARAQEKAFKASATSTSLIATNLRMAGMTTNKAGSIVPTGRRGARGYVPGFAGEAADIRRGVGGVSSGARPVHIPNFAFGGGQRGSMVANTGEYMVPNFRGGGSAIFNPAMVRANGGLPQGAKRITAAQGYVPNFAAPAAYTAGMQIISAGKSGGSLAGWNTHRDALVASGHHSYAKKLQAARDKIQAKRGAAQTKAKTKDLYSIPASEIGIGALTGYQSGADTQSPRSSFSVLLASKDTGKVADPTLLKFMKAHQHKSLQISKLPVAGINKSNQGQTEAELEQHFSSTLNDFMLPALNDYSASIFKSVLGDDGKSFIKELKNNKQRVFSTSTEGGIFESAISLASRNAKAFGGSDSARFDFEEAGHMSGTLRDTFFATWPWITRADAKRSDKSENIRSLLGKSLGTPETAKSIKNFMAGDISAWQKQRRSRARTARAAGGYIPNFAGGLGAALQREKAAGVPSSAIRVNSSPRFQSPVNPAGLAVTNTIDEPRGLRDVPNFADTDIVARSGGQAALLGMPGLDKRGKWAASFNKVLAGAADDWANNRTTTTEFTDRLKSLSNQYGVTGDAQKTVIKNTKALGKQLRPGGGMAGMMAMMMVPMAGGMIEQGVGGRTGSASSGGLTGGVTGGWLGGMAGAAAGAKLGGAMGASGGPVGIGVGITVGTLAGVMTSLEATAASAQSLSGELQTLTGQIQSNGKAAMEYIQAQKDLTAAATEDELTAASNRAAIALEGISDTDLAEQFAAAGKNVDELTNSLERWSGRQAITAKMKGAQAGLLGVAEQGFEDDVERLLAIPKEKDREAAINRKMKGATRGLMKLFMDPALFGRTGKDAVGAEPEDVRKFFKNLFKEGGDTTGWSVWGRLNESELRDHLEKSFGDKGMSGEMIAQMAAVLEAIDPGFWEYQAQDALIKFVRGGELADFYGDMFGAARDVVEKNRGNIVTAANYTRDFEKLLESINDSVLLYTQDLAIIARETAIRDATLTARKGFLGFRGGRSNLAEARGVSAANFAGRRQALDRNIFNENRGSITANLKKVFKTPEGLRGGFQDVFFGPGGFTQGGAAGGINKLKSMLESGEVLELAPDAVEGMATLVTTLEAAYAKGLEAIEKDEKVQEIKFRAEELRARVTEEQFRLALLEEKNINAEKMSMEKARGDFQLFKMRQKRSVESPEAMFGLTPMEQTLKRQAADTNIFNRQRGLDQKQRLSDARQKFIETKTQVALDTTTGKLVDVNLRLEGAINALNATLNGTPTLPPTGVSGPSAHKKPTFGKSIAKEDVEVTLGPLGDDPSIFDVLGSWAKGNIEAVKQQVQRKSQKEAYIKDKISAIKKSNALGANNPEMLERARGHFGREFEAANPVLTADKAVKETPVLTIDKVVKETEQRLKETSVASAAAAPSHLMDTTGYHPLLSAQVGAGFNVENYKLTSDELKFINQQTQEINQAVMAGNEEGAIALARARQSAAAVFDLGNQTDKAADSTKELADNWERVDAAASTKFTAGLRKGFDDVAQQSHFIYRELGEKLPVQFRDNMVGAIGAAMDKTSSLGDALDGVALAFLSTMRQAFLQSAVSNMMNVGKTLWTGSQRGGFITAQNGRFVGGNSTGDRHPALLESGEYVLNRNAVGALGGPEALNSINFGMAPRFQKGGGHLMSLSEKIPSSRFSGLFLQRGNPEYAEYADAASAKQQAAMAKHQKKEQKKAMILSTIISGVMAAGAGWAGSKWGNKPPAGTTQGFNQYGQWSSLAPNPQRGGYIGRQAGGSIGGSVARRYGLFQGGGTVPVSSGAPSLGGSTNTNNISINIGLGGDNNSPGSGASQSATGNTGAPSQATTSDAKALSEKIKSQVLKIITEEQRVGGSLSPGGRRP